MEPQQEYSSVNPESVVVKRLQRIEDWLVLLSLPIALVAFFIWGFASTYPVLAPLLNIIVSDMAILIATVAGIRLGETAWRWWQAGIAEIDIMYGIGALCILLIIILGVVGAIQTILHAGMPTQERSWLIGGTVLVLILQYREIIIRYTKEKREER